MRFETLFILLWMFILVHASIQFWLVRDLIKKHLTATVLEFRQDLKVSIVTLYRNHKSVTLNDFGLYKVTAASDLESLRVDLNVAHAALLCKAGNLTKFSRETAKSVVETLDNLQIILSVHQETLDSYIEGQRQRSSDYNPTVANMYKVSSCTRDTITNLQIAKNKLMSETYGLL